MFEDKELELADGTWAPTATGDNISTNVLDVSPLGTVLNASLNSGRDVGQGQRLFLAITVKTAVTSAGAATVDFRLRSATAANGTTGAVDHVATGALAKTALIAGYQVFLPFPPGAAYGRYICCNANIGTAVLTAGAFQAEIITDEQLNKRYGSGFTLDI